MEPPGYTDAQCITTCTVFLLVSLTACLYAILFNCLPSVPFSCLSPCLSLSPAAAPAVSEWKILHNLPLFLPPCQHVFLPVSLVACLSPCLPVSVATGPYLSASQPRSSSRCLSLKVSVVLRTQHVSICSHWPVSALCSSTHSALNCLLFHLQRVFLFLATDCTHSLQGVYKDTNTASQHTRRENVCPDVNLPDVTVRGASAHFQLSVTGYIYM